MDFTITQYTQLLKSLQDAGFFFQTFEEYITESSSGVINNEHSKDNAINISSGGCIKTPTNEPQTLNTEPRARNKEHETRNKEQRTPNKEQRTPNTEQRTPNKEHRTKNPEQGTKNTEHRTKNTEQRTQNTEHRTKNKLIILRHDVDLLPHHSLRFAQIQHSMGIKGSYYFRAVPESWDEDVIKEIAALGHEVGYHYENMDTAAKSQELRARSGLAYDRIVDLAYKDFLSNLEKLRQLTEVKTICMHGSPRSKYDNKVIWEKYDYKKLGIIGEPYYDMNFDNVFYITDTGRRWDGWKTSVRDKVPQQAEWVKQGLVFHSTQDVIEAVEEGRLPEKIMMTFHPQRWNNKALPWLKELLIQNLKNQIKKLLIKRSK